MKFVQFLETQSLWFARADKFEDPFERTLTDGEVHYRLGSASYSRTSTYLAHARLESTLRDLKYSRITTYMNCWRMGNSESMAMWNPYGKGSGLDIQTNVIFLKGALEARD